MKPAFQNLWPVAAVASLTVVLAVQIPSGALFFVPSRPAEHAPYAAFVEISPEVYGQLVDKVRMTWQRRARTLGGGLDSRVGEFTFDDPLPPPEYLPYRPQISDVSPVPLSFSARPNASRLLPPSLALPRLPVPPLTAARPHTDATLLELPDSIDFEKLD